MNKPLIYLDYAAATPLDERVLDAMTPYFTEQFFNPSSPYQPAIAVRRDYQAAKQTIAEIIGAKSNELVMTAGATESVNLAFQAASGHVIVSSIEHQAVLKAAEQHDHTIVGVDKHGRIHLDAIREAIKPTTTLISIGLANNEIGTIQPLAQIAGLITEERQKRLEQGDTTPLWLHSDASQGIGQLDIAVHRLGIDLLTLNAAKAYGPKQVGLLYAARHVRLTPTIVGGGQEQGLRSGTENVAGVIGFARALEIADKARKGEVERLRNLRDALEARLLKSFPDAVLSGHSKFRLAGHAHISFPGIDAERLIFALETHNVLVATGSACAANKGLRSHVLTAIGLEPDVADGSLRLTLGRGTTEEHIEQAVNFISVAVNRECERVTT